jgi:type II secretory pathway component PulC
MNRVQRTVRALAAPAFLLLICAGAWASDNDEHKVTEKQPEVNAESPAGLPFLVTGTMTAPPTKFAVISMIGREGKGGAQMLASEGAVVAAYRVVSIHPDRVVFERDGIAFLVLVGAERQDSLNAQWSTTQYVRRREAPLRVVAPPANIEEIRQQTGAFVERLKANPQFQKSVETMLRRVREREGASQLPSQP